MTASQPKTFGGKVMRKLIKPQMKIEEIDIPSIQFDVRSRDEIPKILIGLQSVYKDPVARTRFFEDWT
jgi:hypothetical protein